MIFIAIFILCFLAAVLTFFSGFGLGSIVLIGFTFFLPLPQAIAATALVHFINNCGKFSLIYKNIDWQIAFRIGLFSIIGSFLGSWLMSSLNTTSFSISYTIFNYPFTTTLFKICIGGIIGIFAFVEMYKSNTIQTNNKYVQIFGGWLSGFFGGLSGHQGALRSIFLKSLMHKKEVFIATGACIALGVDLIRISSYAWNKQFNNLPQLPLIVVGIFGALFGTFLGYKLLTKTNSNLVKFIVLSLMLLTAIGLCLGLI